MPENGKRRPWWAVAIAGGFGAVLGAAVLLGQSARGEAPHMAAASAVATPERNDTERLARIESKLNELAERLARIEGRLEKR